MDDRDISARNYCYSSRVQILACIRTEEGRGGWGGPRVVGGVEFEGLLAQLLIWYSRLVRKGDLGTSDTYTPTRTHSVEILLNCVSVS